MATLVATRLKALEVSATAQEQKIAALEASAAALEATVTEQAQQITTLEASVAAQAQKIVALEAAAPPATVDLTTINGALASHSTRIKSLEDWRNSAPSITNPNPTFASVTVTNRLIMLFDDTLDANGQPLNAYVELQWMNKRNGKIYHQIVSHGKGSSAGGLTADPHDHLSIYSYEDGAANQREHAFNISVANAEGKPIMGLWDGIQKEQRWTRIVQAPSGQFWQETIEEPGVTKWIKVPGPKDPHPFG